MRTIAKANMMWTSVWIIALSIMTVYTLYTDINGAGLSKTIFYRTLGNLIYPIFYCSVLAGFFVFGKIILHRNHYIAHDGHYLYIAGKNLGDINSIKSVSVKQNVLGIKSIYIEMLNGTAVPVRSYLLDVEIDEIQSALNEIR